MPYRCVHCNSTFADASQEILTGCTCGSKFFFYIKQEKLQQIIQQAASEKDDSVELTSKEKEQMEDDVREIAGLQDQPEKPVFLDFESVRVLKPGKYLIDLGKLFARDKPQIYQLEDGKYIVDLNPLNK